MEGIRDRDLSKPFIQYEVLREAHRWLKSDGTIVVLDKKKKKIFTKKSYFYPYFY